MVTGTSYGLGKSIAEMLLTKGFKVYGISRTKSPIENNNFVWIKADLVKSESFELIESLILDSRIDLLINNAGVAYVEKSLEFNSETFVKIFGLNFLAPIKLTSILKSKLRGGMVVNISSTSDRFVDEGLGAYCASKTALDIYFDAVTLENKDIKVLDILPVFIDTPLLRSVAERLKFSLDFATKPEKLAEVIKEIIFSNNDLESGARIITLSNKTLDNTKDPEKLYYYNVDTKEFKKLK